MKRYEYLFIFVCTSLPGLLLAQGSTGAIELSPSMVVRRITQASTSAKEIGLMRDKAHLAQDGALAAFDTLLTAQTQIQNNRTEILQGFSGQSDQSVSLRSSLSKSLDSGTSISLSYEQVYQDAQLPGLLRALREPRQNYANLGLQVNQSLLRDAFGKASRGQLALAEAGVIQAGFAADQQIENLALLGLELYWQAFAGAAVIRELDKSVQRLERLATYSKERQKVGAADVGEIERVEADLEAQKQRLGLNRSAFRQLLERVTVLLKLEIPQGELALDFEKRPALGKRLESLPLSLDELRQIKLAQSQVETSRLAEEVVQSSTDPKLNAFARVNSTGMDPQLKQSYGEVLGGRRPSIALGLEFEMYLDQRSSKTKLAEKRIEQVQSQLNLERLRDEVVSQERALLVDAQGRYDAAQHAQSIVKLRQAAASALEKAFRQGRIGLDQLTLALNALIASEIDRHQAFSQYFLSVDRYRAMRNELVDFYLSESK